jgi:2-dehydro-3-deoxyphosphogluconate aldolase/(4S)-4-hydroxy-2-oxoglutarate aldolase
LVAILSTEQQRSQPQARPNPRRSLQLVQGSLSARRVERQSPLLAGLHRVSTGVLAGLGLSVVGLSTLSLHWQNVFSGNYAQLQASRNLEQKLQESAALLEAFPSLLLGAASLHSLEGLEAARQAGFSYGVSPILDQELCHRAGEDLVLVPGVMTPTEVHHARGMGCRLVKLFPAASLGPGYWRRLAAPLGEPLPFCIAAGGLGPQDVPQWLAAGVDAVALGSALPLLTPATAEAASPKPAALDPAASGAGDPALAALAALLAQLGETPERSCHPVAPKP